MPDLFAVLRSGALLLSLLALSACDDPAASNPPPAVKPTLSVRLVQPEQSDWPVLLSANGDVRAWQEALIGAELANERIAAVAVDVGDRVAAGAVLARLADARQQADAAEARAAVAEAQAAAREAEANAGRARDLKAQGFYSSQLVAQYLTAAQTAAARLAAAQARQQAADIRLAQTVIRAPAAGVIASRDLAVGSLTQSGQVLFRLIRDGRLEWQAEIAAADLAALRAGQTATVQGPDGAAVEGRLRRVAPAVDRQTRNGLVFVDLPASTALKAGMFARGSIQLGSRPALHLPQAAIVQRDGFAYVFRLADAQRVLLSKVELGRRQGERVEIVSGLKAGEAVVADGVGFLADGDRVSVVKDAAQ
jgi:RND family efflux transporter MFP subunit